MFIRFVERAVAPFVAVSMLLVLCSVSHVAQAQPSTQTTPKPLVLDPTLRNAARDDRPRADRRSAAETARIASRSAYQSLDPSASRRLLHDRFGATLRRLSANPNDRIERRGRILRYRDDHSALVALDSGGRALARSVLPLRTDDEPLDLTLRASPSDFVPRRPAADLSIARDHRGGVTLEPGVRFSLLGHASSGVTDDTGVVFFPDVAPDTDAAVTPTAGGVDLSVVLRSPRSPRTLRYRVDMPDGMRLDAEGDGATVTRGGRGILSIEPPTAIDAQGTAVPVSMAVDGRSLRLRVNDGDDVVYPILVDPQVALYPLYDETGWSFRNCTDDPRITAQGIGQVTYQAGTYPGGTCGYWVWEGVGEEFFTVFDDSWGSRFLQERVLGATTGQTPTSPSCVLDRYSGWTAKFYSRNSSAPVCGNRFFFGSDVIADPFTLDSEQSAGLQNIVAYVQAPSDPVAREELFGSSNAASPNAVRSCAGDPVNCATGNFYESQTDLQLRGRGLPFELTRTYNAQDGSAGPFGRGWSASFGDRLSIDSEADRVTVIQDNGSVVPFARTDGVLRPVNPSTEAELDQASDGSFVYRLPDESEMHFDAAGRLLRRVDRVGNALVVDRDGAQRVTSITDGAGRTITLAYTPDGKHVARATGPMGSVAYGYDADARLTEVTALDGGVWRFEYDSRHRMTRLTDPLGRDTVNQYDADDRVTSQTDGAGQVRTWSYPSVDQTVVTNPAGDITDESFNQAEEPVRITRGAGTSSATTHKLTYDDALNLVQITDGAGEATRFTYDSAGNRLSLIDPLGNTTRWTYNARGDIESETNALGQKTTYTYFSDRPLLAHVERKHTESGNVVRTSFEYNQQGDLTGIGRGGGLWTSLAYDAAGNCTSTTTAAGVVTGRGYDTSGYLTSTTSPAGKRTTIRNDALGRPTAMVDPLGRESKTSYDAVGNTASTTDAAGRVTAYGFDGVNRIVSVKRPDGSTLSTAYDANGRLRSQTDAAGRKTEYAHDPSGRVHSITDPLGRATTFTYDAVGRVTGSTDASGRTTTYRYDAASRRTSIAYSDAGTPNVSVSYDALGRRRTMSDGTGSWTSVYDSLGRLTAVNDAAGQRTGYGYDLLDNQTSIVYPNGKTVTRAFDADGRLESVTDWLGNQTSFAYDASAALRSTTFPTATANVDTYGYDDAGDLTSVAMKRGTTTVAETSYTRDAVGRVASARSTGVGPATETYGYSELGQLASVDGRAYEYDAADNPTRLANGPTSSYDAANQLTGSAHVFDALGERRQTRQPGVASFAYTFDKARRLTGVTPSGASPTLAGGDSHSLAIGAGGAVHAWGLNSSGQLGNDTTSNSSSPVAVAGLAGATSVAAGATHSLAVKRDGTVWSWGANANGQLGNNTTTAARAPGQVPGLTGVSHIASAPGAQHSLALKTDGTAWAWGLNASGQLGNNTTTSARTPVQVSGLTAATAVGAGANHALAVRSGAVWAWGANSCGQLGNNTTTAAKVPVQTSGLTGVVAVAGGGCHSLALKTDGTVWAWGSNTAGQLGNGTTTTARTPVQVRNLTGVVAIAAGANHSLALKSDGTVRAWGSGASGQLGTGSSANATSATQVPALADVGAVGAGATHSAYATGSGKASSAGLNASGQLGTGTTANSSSATAVSGLAGVRAFTAAGYTYDGDGLRASVRKGDGTQRLTWDKTSAIPSLLADDTNSYLYGPDGLPFQQISSSGVVSYLHHDQLGSTRMLTNSAGAATATFTYDAHGGLSARTGTSDTPLRWAGQSQDQNTGLTYLRARYYDPGTAQFLSRDPLQALTRAPYTYGDGDPINAIDPTGLLSFDGVVDWVHDASGKVSAVAGTAALGLAATGIGAPAAGPLAAISFGAAGVSAGTGTVRTIQGRQGGGELATDVASFGLGAAGQSLANVSKQLGQSGSRWSTRAGESRFVRAWYYERRAGLAYRGSQYAAYANATTQLAGLALDSPDLMELALLLEQSGGGPPC